MPCSSTAGRGRRRGPCLSTSGSSFAKAPRWREVDCKWCRPLQAPSAAWPQTAERPEHSAALASHLTDTLCGLHPLPFGRQRKAPSRYFASGQVTQRSSLPARPSDDALWPCPLALAVQSRHTCTHFIADCLRMYVAKHLPVKPRVRPAHLPRPVK